MNNPQPFETPARSNEQSPSPTESSSVDPQTEAREVIKQLFDEMESKLAGFTEFADSLAEMDQSHDYYTALIEDMDPALVDEKLDAMDVVAFDLGSAHTRAQQVGRSLDLLSPAFKESMLALHQKVHSQR